MKRSFVICLTLFVLLVGLFIHDLPIVTAQTQDPTDYDTYYDNWSGIRPTAPGSHTLQYGETVASYGNDQYVELGLHATINHIETDHLSTTDDDVEISVLIEGNGRFGIRYALQGPYSQTWYTNGTDLGITADNTGTWLDLPIGVTFWGAPACEGVYSRVWISDNGFLSFTDQSTSTNPVLDGNPPNTIVAPFWRDLDPSDRQGSIRWTYSFEYGFVDIIWNNIKNRANNNRQSFSVRIYRETYAGQNTIEFRYGQITPNDGIPTAVGIENQYGTRYHDISLSDLASNQYWQFVGDVRPMYLNSFKLTIYDYVDNDASMYFLKDPNNPLDTFLLGDNLLYRSPRQLDPLPFAAKGILAGAGLASKLAQMWGLGTSLSVLGGVGLIFSGISITWITYDLVATSMWNAIATEIVDAERTDNEARIKSYIRYGGTFNYAASDASLTTAFIWKFHDIGNNVEHRLRLTAEVGYSESAAGADINFASTSVELDMIPGEQIYQADFNGGTLGGWSALDLNPTSGDDYWGLVNRKFYEGTQSVWCSGNTPTAQQYDNYMDAIMTLPLQKLSGFTKFYLYAKMWISTQKDRDPLYIKYYDGSSRSWITKATYSGQISTSKPRKNTPYTEWLSLRFELPSSLRALRFEFVSDGSIVDSGIYIDHIRLLGIPPEGTAQAWPGDLNGDNQVNAIDLSMFAASYGKHSGDPGYIPSADFDHDLYVGPIDLSYFAAAYGKPYSS